MRAGGKKKRGDVGMIRNRPTTEASEEKRRREEKRGGVGGL